MNVMYSPVFLISSYGAPLAQRVSYLALHSSLFEPVAQLIMITLSLTPLAQYVFPMVHTLTTFEPIWPILQNISKTLVLTMCGRLSSVCVLVQDKRRTDL